MTTTSAASQRGAESAEVLKRDLRSAIVSELRDG
jgi:hypothetical protein